MGEKQAHDSRGEEAALCVHEEGDVLLPASRLSTAKQAPVAVFLGAALSWAAAHFGGLAIAQPMLNATVLILAANVWSVERAEDEGDQGSIAGRAFLGGVVGVAGVYLVKSGYLWFAWCGLTAGTVLWSRSYIRRHKAMYGGDPKLS